MGFCSWGNTDNLNVSFRFPEKDEALFVSSIYEEEKNQSSSTVLLRVLTPIAAIVLMCGIIWILAANMHSLREELFKIIAFPCFILSLFVVWEIIKRIRLSNAIQKAKAGSFMLAEVQYVDKMKSSGYYKQISFIRCSYYVTISDKDGNQIQMKTCRNVYESAGIDGNLYLIRFVSGRGYWNKLDLYSSGKISPFSAISMDFLKK